MANKISTFINLIMKFGIHKNYSGLRVGKCNKLIFKIFIIVIIHCKLSIKKAIFAKNKCREYCI